ncbi:MAG: tRNA epoxyqueuosine(34) reductase QueG, partial [bacterium]|nr:tRNA epoxyqueuosine(34) reductase QueG [bacterium]
CQEVCPYNQKSSAEAAPDYAVRPPAPRPALEEIAGWTEDDYRASLAGSAVKRATLAMLKRNAAIAQHNHRRP